MGILGDDFYYQADLNAIKSYERNEGWQEGWSEGWQEGRAESIKGAIELCQEIGISRDAASSKISEIYALDAESTNELMQEYWKES